MSGIQEILLIVLLILALLILPRMLPSKRQPAASGPHKVKGVRISGKLRLALLISFLWLFVFSAIYLPWGEQWLKFLYVGVGPIILAWGLFWVFKGFSKHRRR